MKLLALPLSFHREAGSGDTLSRILGDVQINQRAVELARSGDVRAIKELLDRLIGKPVEADLLERIEQLEVLLQDPTR